MSKSQWVSEPNIQEDKQTNFELLCDFDYFGIDELDPTLEGGWNLLYDREIPGEIRIQNNISDKLDEIGAIEPLNFKICVKGSECNPAEIKVEITSEHDLFLHYHFILNNKEFKQYANVQHLLIDLPDFPAVLMKMSNNCIMEPANYVIVIILYPDGSADCSFIQNAEYKFVELLRLPLLPSSEEMVRKSILFRHNTVKSKLAILHSKFQDICLLIKENQPELLKNFLTTPPMIYSACPLSESHNKSKSRQRHQKYM